MSADTGWAKYPKMPNASRPEGYARATKRGAEHVVTEKVHGANFSVLAFRASGAVEFAKRTAVLAPADDFFGCRSAGVTAVLRPAARAAAAAVGADVAIFGELFGGLYPHEAVAPVQGLQPVQRGVYYAPTVQFCAFDVQLLASGRFLDFDDAQVSLFG